MNTAAWGAEEQRLLEQALKTFPSSTPDRWDRIAECVPNRTKKDCMRRYKVSSGQPQCTISHSSVGSFTLLFPLSDGLVLKYRNYQCCHNFSFMFTQSLMENHQIFCQTCYL